MQCTSASAKDYMRTELAEIASFEASFVGILLKSTVKVDGVGVEHAWIEHVDVLTA